eukprot:TRINITY_DN12636_c0_g2_i1.p1 TRINITY_DN12636_c0_g2~~TRINITY_DN12636_c0_g2_i1.p1  ORF type:complete len:395 (-),score=51.70 TRINITY_DN12636_c0_g2_i1:29-1177(-)
MEPVMEALPITVDPLPTMRAPRPRPTPLTDLGHNDDPVGASTDTSTITAPGTTCGPALAPGPAPVHASAPLPPRATAPEVSTEPSSVVATPGSNSRANSPLEDQLAGAAASLSEVRSRLLHLGERIEVVSATASRAASSAAQSGDVTPRQNSHTGRRQPLDPEAAYRRRWLKEVADAVVGYETDSSGGSGSSCSSSGDSSSYTGRVYLRGPVARRLNPRVDPPMPPPRGSDSQSVTSADSSDTSSGFDDSFHPEDKMHPHGRRAAAAERAASLNQVLALAGAISAGGPVIIPPGVLDNRGSSAFFARAARRGRRAANPGPLRTPPQRPLYAPPERLPSNMQGPPGDQPHNGGFHSVIDRRAASAPLRRSRSPPQSAMRSAHR